MFAKQHIQLLPGQRVHFIGIGGFGLSAIARVLLEQGFIISGSDKNTNELTEALRRDGATIYNGHNPVYVEGADMVIMTSAASGENIEALAASALNIPVYRRSEIIGTIMAGHRNIAIAGTHGKTTTTAMTTHILLENGKDPSYIVGGVMGNTRTNAGVGQSDLFVIEADEYDNMFHGLRPQIEVITSVEYDHPDFFRTPHQMMESFSHFVALLPEDGLLIACDDDPTCQIFARNREIVQLPVATYAIQSPLAKWRAEYIRYLPDRTVFDVTYKGHLQGVVTLPMAGKHNVLNALAALIVANSQEIRFADAAAALSTYQGTGRRFEVLADVNGIAIVNDYAHHPTAIKTTIEAARLRYPEREVWAVWQPHTYSRTQALMESYIRSFDEAHHVLITEIYAAREKPVEGVTSADIVEAMRHPHVEYTPLLEDALELLQRQVTSPAVILVMSAGNATRIADEYLKGLRAKDSA